MGTLFRIGDRNIDRIKGDRWDYTKCYLDNDEYMEGNEDSIQDRIEEIKNEIEELENEDDLRVHVISHFEDELYNLQCTNIEDCIKIWSSSYDILGIYPLSELKDLSNNGYGYVFLDEDIVDINELEDGYYQLIDEDNNYLLLKIEDNNEIELFEDKILIKNKNDIFEVINIDDFDDYAVECYQDDDAYYWKLTDLDELDCYMSDEEKNKIRNGNTVLCCMNENYDWEIREHFINRLIII